MTTGGERTRRAITSFSGRYLFLDNFAWAPVVYEGVRYPTTEHAFQAAKSLDPAVRVQFSLLRTPGAAKALGQQVPLRADWEAVKRDVMLAVLRQKFAAGSRLAPMLLATGDAELIEGNHHGDMYWGMVDGVGENWLGRLLMQVRTELRPTPLETTL